MDQKKLQLFRDIFRQWRFGFMFGILILYLYGSSCIAHRDARGHARPAQDPFFMPIHKRSQAPCEARPLLGYKYRAQQSLLDSSWTEFSGTVHLEHNKSKFSITLKKSSLLHWIWDSQTGQETLPPATEQRGTTHIAYGAVLVQLPQLLLCHVTQQPDPSFSHKSQSKASAHARNEALSKMSCQCQRLARPKGESKKTSTVFTSFSPL